MTSTSFFSNSITLTNSLFSMGAHIGHLHVEAFDSLSYYILGTRSLFVIFDLQRTVSYLKNAIIFFEHLVSNFGNALFRYSGISMLNIHIKLFFINLIKDRNQSFSYWRWAPGCITNYRTVFLRLVNHLFSYSSFNSKKKYKSIKRWHYAKSLYRKEKYKEMLNRLSCLYLYKDNAMDKYKHAYLDRIFLRSFFLRYKHVYPKFSIRYLRLYNLVHKFYLSRLYKEVEEPRIFRAHYDYKNEKHVNIGSLSLEEVEKLKNNQYVSLT